jgi:hypothetical protein
MSVDVEWQKQAAAEAAAELVGAGMVAGPGIGTAKGSI